MLAQTVTLTTRLEVRDLWALCKPRLSLLVLCTTGVGLWLAPGLLPWPRALATLLATALVVGAANALNCYIERDSDARMKRTRNRPLAARRLEPRLALWVSLVAAAVAIAALYRVANPLTALLSFVAYAVYGWVYTPMKRYSFWAVVIGAIPGAIPPLMGWTAVTGTIGWPGLALFAILFFWQLPHFLAIAVYLKDDYARAGLRVLPLVHGTRATIGWTIAAACALVPASLWPVWQGAGPVYGAGATVLGLGFVGCTLTGLVAGPAGRWARSVFVASIAYLTLLMGLLVAGPR